MQHPRRNEVFRDVGSRWRLAGDDAFIEIRRCSLKPDAAFLICSDGLTDQLTSAQVREIVERYDGDPAGVAAELVPRGQRGRRQGQHDRAAGSGSAIPGARRRRDRRVARGRCALRCTVADPLPPAHRADRVPALRPAARDAGVGRHVQDKGVTEMTAPSHVGRYAIVRRLSKSMTDVFLAVDTVDNRQAALKLIKSAPDMMTQTGAGGREAGRRAAAGTAHARSAGGRNLRLRGRRRLFLRGHAVRGGPQPGARC